MEARINDEQERTIQTRYIPQDKDNSIFRTTDHIIESAKIPHGQYHTKNRVANESEFK